MIKISDSSLVKSSDKVLHIIAKLHLDKVNGKVKKTSEYKVHCIYRRLLSLKVLIESKDYLNKECNKNKAKRNRHLNFVDYLLSENGKHLEYIILAKPSRLKKIIEDVNKIIKPVDFKDGKKYTKLYNEISKNVFKYKEYRATEGCVNIYKELINENTHCFYCNINKISNIKKKTSARLKGLFDLDHFYLKSKYPYLSLSFYNLIPCCHNCNSPIRGDIDFDIRTHINPYEESFDDHFTFTLDELEVMNTNLGKQNSITKLKIQKKAKSYRNNDSTILDLGIEEVYANELRYINSLGDTIIKHYNLKAENPSDFVDMVYGINYSKIPKDKTQIHEYSLSKLSIDVISLFKECSSIE